MRVAPASSTLKAGELRARPIQSLEAPPLAGCGSSLSIETLLFGSHVLGGLGRGGARLDREKGRRGSGSLLQLRNKAWKPWTRKKREI